VKSSSLGGSCSSVVGVVGVVESPLIRGTKGDLKTTNPHLPKL